MARSVTFGGVTQFRPGGLTRINANALTPIGQSATGIIGLIGEADGGVPGEVIDVDDPALAASIFTSGPLADAIKIAFNPSADPRIPGGAFRCRCYKTNQGTQAKAHLPGSTSLISDTVASATTTAITLTTGMLTVSAHIGRWLKISGESRRIVANTSTIVTVEKGFSTAPVSTTAVVILNDEFIVTSQGYGTLNNSVAIEVEDGVGANTKVVTISLGTATEQSPEICGDAWLSMKYLGGPIPVEGVSSNLAQNLPVTAASTSTITATVTTAPTAAQYAGMMLQFSDGKQRLITSHTAASPCVFTLDAASVLTAAEAVAVVGENVTVRGVTTATVSIVGSSGAATSMTSSVAPTADNLNITFTAGMTLQNLVDLVNATTNYQATIPPGVNAQTTLMSSFDFGTRNTTVDVRFDSEIDPADNGTFRRDLQEMIDWINNFSQLVTAARATAGSSEGANLPTDTGGVASVVRDVPLYLVGGTRGTSTNTNFQNGFDAILQTRVNSVVPLISQDLTIEGNGSTATFASVAAQASSFALTAAGAGKNECGVYLGAKMSKTQLIAQLASLNNTDVQLTAQQLTVLNTAGNLVVQPEWSGAVAAAGMRAGAPEVGEPLTFKFINCSGIAQDASWSPKSTTDVNALLDAGLLFAEVTPKGTIRWVRDVTSYQVDDNIAYLDGNTRDAVRFIAYDFRQQLEDEFTGLKASPATVANIREFAGKTLQGYLTSNILVNSLDPETQTTIIPGWRKLRVFISGNVATLRVELFVTTGIVWELTDVYLMLPTISG